MKKACAHARSIAALGFVLAGVLLLCCPDAWALDPALDVSQYAHTSWKVRDGFTKGSIYAIAQTSDGYLWLGTEFGLFRFDGVRAVPWELQGQALPSTYITRLFAASDGTLWIGTLKGLASWKDGNLTAYPELADHVVLQMIEDREGTVWAGTVGTAFGTTTGRLCAIRKGGVQCFEDGSFKAGVTGLYEDSKGTLWAGVKDGLWRWKPGPPRFFSLPTRVATGIEALGEDTNGTLLFGWRGGLWRFLDGKTEAYPLPRVQFRARQLLRDRDGGLWVATQDRGIAHVHSGKTDMFSVSEGLSGEDSEFVFQDREGSIWIAAHDGLDRFRDFAVATISVKQGLSDVHVGSVVADADGTVWLTNRTLQRWKNGRVVTDDNDEKRFRGHFPHSLFRDRRGRIWVCTHEGVGYFANRRFIPLTGIPGGAAVHGITEDSAGNIWIARQGAGLFRLSAQGEVQEIPQESLGNDDLVYTLAGDPMRGGLWAGFYKGGIIYLRDGQTRASYSTADGLGGGWVTELRVDLDGTLWAATQGGLSRLKSGRISTLNSKNGLPCDTVHWSIEDDDHSLWLNTACGLVRIGRADLDAWAAAVDKDKDAKRTVQATVFGSSDGVRARGISGGTATHFAKSPDGKLWFPMFDDGLGVIDPRHLPFNKLPPPVHIEQITADRKTYGTTPDASGLVPLPARIRDLQVDYTALNLVAPERIRFRYKLEGRDSDWQDAGNRRQAFYTDLPPRSYRFRVAACNNSGVWNEAGTFLDFAVAPAYYQTLWFRLSCVAAFLAMLAGVYVLRLRQVAQQFNMRLEARVGERTRIARDLHDSLLQGVQGLMFRLQAVRELLPGHPSEAMKALDTALERGDKVIVEGRDTISDLRQSAVGDSDIAQALTALGEELAAQSNNGTAPCVRVLVEGKRREIDPVLRDEIYRIAREALRNAFRHSEAQKIEAQITYGESEFLLHVRDDGIGIAPQVASQGARAGHWGLPGMRERAKGFGGKLEVWSEQGAGTEIELTIPAAVSYGKSNARRKSWFLRKKN